MKKLPTFDEFINEERVYGMFNDSQGKPSKLSKEILEICLRGLPKNIVDNIAEVEAAGYFLTNMKTPPTVSNKGASTGRTDYTAIVLIFKQPLGRSKITDLTVGLRKRTSGPGTGYLAIKPSANGYTVFADENAAIEFWNDPAKALNELYKSSLEKYI